MRRKVALHPPTTASRRALAIACLPLAALGACSSWFFSGESTDWIDRSRPVVLLETTGGVEFGASTEFGVLSLGRTATEGPCRVHYFMGRTPVIESGELQATGSLFTEAVIDLKTQMVRVFDRDFDEYDRLTVMWTPDGQQVESVRVQPASGEGLHGDLLADPGVELPTGATVLCRDLHGTLMFVGLIAGRATVDGGASAGSYYVYAGPDRVRELLAVPERHPVDMVPEYRPDGITTMRPVEDAKPPASAPEAGGQ